MGSVVTELRKAIARAEKAGASRYAIAKKAGIALPVLIRIADGKGLARIDTAEKIANAVGARLTLVTN